LWFPLSNPYFISNMGANLEFSSGSAKYCSQHMEISLQLDALTHLHAIPEPTKVNPLSLTISSDEGWLSSHLTRLMYVCT